MITKEQLQDFTATYGDFFERFREQQRSLESDIVAWQNENPEGSIKDYVTKCFSEAFAYMSRHANTELEFSKWKLEFDTHTWNFKRKSDSSDANFWLRQIHIDKVIIAVHSEKLPLQVSISSKLCCSKCARHDGKQVSLESILKGRHIPYSNCINEEHCKCSYIITT